MEQQEVFHFTNGMRLERVQYTGQWRLSWPHDGKEISRDISLAYEYIVSLAKALGA